LPFRIRYIWIGVFTNFLFIAFRKENKMKVFLAFCFFFGSILGVGALILFCFLLAPAVYTLDKDVIKLSGEDAACRAIDISKTVRGSADARTLHFGFSFSFFRGIVFFQKAYETQYGLVYKEGRLAIDNAYRYTFNNIVASMTSIIAQNGSYVSEDPLRSALQSCLFPNAASKCKGIVSDMLLIGGLLWIPAQTAGAAKFFLWIFRIDVWMKEKPRPTPIFIWAAEGLPPASTGKRWGRGWALSIRETT
jgi:hypothetical protein